LFSAELHKRFTECLYPLAFALFAFAAAGDARSHRQGGLPPLVVALGAALLVRWLGFISENAAKTGPEFVYAMYAIPVLSSAAAGWFILANRRMEVPVSLSDRILVLTDAAQKRYIAFKVWRSGFQRPTGRRA
jgi:lipopolysaccharide export system permease protein